MSELDAIKWLEKMVAWTMDRDGGRWTLKVWACPRGSNSAAVKHEYAIDESTGPGVAFVGLVRLAAHDLEGR